MDMPNVLWIFVDEHRGQAMSCAGDQNIQTPTLDRLGEEGVYFPRAYSNTPICTPARGCVYTGQHAHMHGAKANHYPLLPNTPQMAEVMQAAGYRTAHFGKWHLAGGSVHQHVVSPFFRPGWDDWIGWECMHGYAGDGTYYETRYQEGDLGIKAKTIDKFQADWLTDRSIEWMNERANEDQPWFHCVSIETPHPPVDFPANVSLPHWQLFADKELQLRDNVPEHLEAEAKEFLKGYYSHIANIDDNVQRMLQSLESNGQLENTIIVYFSDHGDFAKSHGRDGKNDPREESTHIPFLVRLPSKLNARANGKHISDSFISLVDVMPSTLGLCGIEIPESCQGIDMSGEIRGEHGQTQDHVYVSYHNGYHAQKKASGHWRSIRNKNWMFAVNLEDGPQFLFDMNKDPYQLQNLVNQSEHAATQEQLLALMRSEAGKLNDNYFEKYDRLFAMQTA